MAPLTIAIVSLGTWQEGLVASSAETIAPTTPLPSRTSVLTGIARTARLRRTRPSGAGFTGGGVGALSGRSSGAAHREVAKQRPVDGRCRSSSTAAVYVVAFGSIGRGRTVVSPTDAGAGGVSVTSGTRTRSRRTFSGTSSRVAACPERIFISQGSGRERPSNSTEIDPVICSASGSGVCRTDGAVSRRLASPSTVYRTARRDTFSTSRYIKVVFNDCATL